MKKIAIIGGGITGCLSGLHYANLGYKVEIFEKNNFLGGIMTDIETENDFYFNGPNYFEANSWWIKELKKDDLFKKFFFDFKLKYGSYNDLFNSKIYSNNFAQLVTNEKFTKITKKNSKLYVNRISSYQNKIATQILNWSEKFCSQTNKLHEACSLLINTGRVFFKNDKKKILKLKRTDKFADKILGVPDIKHKEENYCVPGKGFKIFFEKLYEYLEIKSVKIHLNSRISIENESKLSLLNNQKKIFFDYAIWCANPVQLISKTKIGNLDNPIVKVKTIVFDVELKNTFKGNIYIQVFLRKNNLFRIFIYKIKNKIKMSLELIFDKNINIKNETELALKILDNMGYKIKKNSYVLDKNEVRHMLFTRSDLKKFELFEKKESDFKIISGAWYTIGRENKVSQIIKRSSRYIIQ
jgi:hypothetical protein